MMKILEFFELRDMRNAWMVSNGQNLYLRKSIRFIAGTKIRCIDIANVETPVKKQGGGRFKHNLALITGQAIEHGYHALYVENVLNVRFAQYFRDNGWTETDGGSAEGDGPPCFYRFL